MGLEFVEALHSPFTQLIHHQRLVGIADDHQIAAGAVTGRDDAGTSVEKNLFTKKNKWVVICK